jgi:putative transposase
MRPSREPFRQTDQTYFATFQTARRQCFFRNDRWASLFLTTLARYIDQLGLHDFVLMPDHIHLLLSPQVPLERAIQLVKGGFSDHRLRDAQDWDNHREYIRKNGISWQSEGKAICGSDSSLSLHPLPPWLKPHSRVTTNGGAEAPPLQNYEGEGR